MRKVRRASLAAMLSLALIGGCATPQLADPEVAEYRRVDARLRAIDDYESFKRACRENGGVVFSNRSWGRVSPKPPDLADLECRAPLPNLGLR